MADIPRGNRPLSPHIMIYRPQLTSVSSIFVRITGIGLLVTVALIVWWLIAAASSPGAFAFINMILTSWFGDLVLLASMVAVYYHMLGRLRHVIWDFGYWLDVKTSEKMAIGMFAGSVVLTGLSVALIKVLS